MDYSRGMLDIGRKAKELDVDGATLKRTLDDLLAITRETSENGNSITITLTITHTTDSSLGRTEVMIGNTRQAIRGETHQKPDWGKGHDALLHLCGHGDADHHGRSGQWLR